MVAEYYMSLRLWVGRMTALQIYVKQMNSGISTDVCLLAVTPCYDHREIGYWKDT